MDRFLEKGGARSYAAAAPRTGQPQIEAQALACTDPIVDSTPAMEVSTTAAPPFTPHTVQPSLPPPQAGDIHNIELMAHAVAALLFPMIASSVEKAINAGMQKLQAQLGEHATRLNEAEHRIANIEEELYQAQSTEHAQYKTNKYILDKE